MEQSVVLQAGFFLRRAAIYFELLQDSLLICLCLMSSIFTLVCTV